MNIKYRISNKMEKNIDIKKLAKRVREVLDSDR